MPKDELELFQQFEEYGYVTHDCPICGEESPTEPDANQAVCTNCNKVVKVESII